MFLYSKSECHNQYNTDRLDAIELMAVVAAAVAVLVWVVAVIALAVVSKSKTNAKINARTKK